MSGLPGGPAASGCGDLVDRAQDASGHNPARNHGERDDSDQGDQRVPQQMRERRTR